MLAKLNSIFSIFLNLFLGNNSGIVAPNFNGFCSDKKITNLIICGFETHICIQQSVLDFLKKGYEVLVISDAMGSRNRADHEIALQRMTQSGAFITTTESIIFELCKTADRKEFKEIRNIIIR